MKRDPRPTRSSRAPMTPYSASLADFRRMLSAFESVCALPQYLPNGGTRPFLAELRAGWSVDFTRMLGGDFCHSPTNRDAGQFRLGRGCGAEPCVKRIGAAGALLRERSAGRPEGGAFAARRKRARLQKPSLRPSTRQARAERATVVVLATNVCGYQDVTFQVQFSAADGESAECRARFGAPENCTVLGLRCR